jgi:hypothetical protein
MPRPTPIIIPGSGGMGSNMNSGEVNLTGAINLLASIFGPEGLLAKQEAMNQNAEAARQVAEFLGITPKISEGQPAISGKPYERVPVQQGASSFVQAQTQAEIDAANAEIPQELTPEQQTILASEKPSGANYLVNTLGIKPGINMNLVSGSPLMQKELIDTLGKILIPKTGVQEPVMYERISPDTNKHETTIFDKHKIDLASLNQGVKEEQYKWKPYEKGPKEQPLIKEVSGNDPMFEKGSPLRQKNHDPSVSYLVRFDPDTNQPIANYGRSGQENRYLPYVAAPNMPPGWDINRKTGKWEFKGTPGGESKETLQGMAESWIAIKKSIQVANDSKARNMQASGSALFEGTKDNTGRVVIPATFDRLVQLRDELPEGVLGTVSDKLKAFNTFDQFVKWQTSDPKMAELKSTIIAAAERMGNIYSGGGSVTSDQKMKLAQELIDPRLGKDAFRALIQGHTKDLMNIVNTYGKTWTTTPGQEPRFMPQENTPVPSGKGYKWENGKLVPY